jgi:hypothetical protein
LAKREIRITFIPLPREVRAMRLRLSGLARSFSALDRQSKAKLRQAGLNAAKKIIESITPTLPSPKV